MNENLILIVAPRPAFIRTLKRVLEPQGFAVVGATNGPEGVSLFERDRPRVVIVDPDVDGAGTMFERTADVLGTAVIMVTRQEQVGRLADLDRVDDVIFRDDLFVETLLDSVSHLLTMATEREDAPNRRLLVVDSYPDALELYSTFLADRGYDVLTARHGKEALKLIGSDSLVDAVLLGLTPPGFDELETLDRLLAEPDAPGVVMIGAGSSREIRERAHRLGAFDYLAKPVDFRRLESAVSACVATHSRYPATIPVAPSRSSHPRSRSASQAQVASWSPSSTTGSVRERSAWENGGNVSIRNLDRRSAEAAG